MRQLISNWEMGCVLCVFYVATAATLSAQVTVTSNVTIGGPSPWYDVTANSVPTGSQGPTALNTLLGNCNGGTVFFPPGTYTFTGPAGDPIIASSPCTIMSWGQGATIQKGANMNTSANYTDPGYVLITASNVTLRGIIFDCNTPTYTGACVVAQGPITDLLLDGVKIINCDGPCFLSEATSAGGQGPNRVTVQNSVLVSGINSSTAAGGTISVRDSYDSHKYINNPLIDGHLDGYSGSATFELECGNVAATCSNVLIADNPKVISTCNSYGTTGSNGSVLGGGGWAVQAGAFGGYAMYGLKVENNGFEHWCNSNGLISVPSTYDAVISGNHLNTHFRDLYASGTHGATTNGTDTFTDTTYANFIGPSTCVTFGCATGRTLKYLCGSAWYETIVTWSSTSVVVPNVTPTCTGTGELWELWGYSPSFTEIELGNSIGPTVTGNACDCETSQFTADIWGDATSNATVSNNLLFGWGEGQVGSASAATIGIGFNTGYVQNNISSVTLTGHIATINTGSALIGQTQAGMKIALCDTASPNCVPHSANGLQYGIYQIYNVPVSGGTSFTIYYPIDNTGAAPVTLCSTGCGGVDYVSTHNIAVGNVLEFPKLMPTSGNSFAMQAKLGSNANNYQYDITFEDNTVIGTNQEANQYCGSIQQSATGTQDSISFIGNICTNIANGFNRTAGTNERFLDNQLNNVTTAWPGSSQPNEVVRFSAPVVCNVTTCPNLSGTGFGTGPTSASNTSAIEITLGTTPAASTGTIGSLYPPAPNGWACSNPIDISGLGVAKQSASTINSITLSFSTAGASGDKIILSCQPY